MQNARPRTSAKATSDIKPASPSINFVFNTLCKLSLSSSTTGASTGASTAAVSTAAVSTAAVSTCSVAAASASSCAITLEVAAKEQAATNATIANNFFIVFLILKLINLLYILCGETGIRTPEPLWTVTRFPGVPLQPLEHLSKMWTNTGFFSPMFHKTVCKLRKKSELTTLSCTKIFIFFTFRFFRPSFFP